MAGDEEISVRAPSFKAAAGMLRGVNSAMNMLEMIERQKVTRAAEMRSGWYGHWQPREQMLEEQSALDRR